MPILGLVPNVEISSCGLLTGSHLSARYPHDHCVLHSPGSRLLRAAQPRLCHRLHLKVARTSQSWRASHFCPLCDVLHTAGALATRGGDRGGWKEGGMLEIASTPRQTSSRLAARIVAGWAPRPAWLFALAAPQKPPPAVPAPARGISTRAADPPAAIDPPYPEPPPGVPPYLGVRPPTPA